MRHHGGYGQRRSGFRQAGIPAIALAGVALLAAGCSGNAPAQGSSAPGTVYQRALDYSQCMRAHGEANFPDPDGNGAIPDVNNEINQSSPQYVAANKSCENIRSPDGTQNDGNAGSDGHLPPQIQAMLSQALKYSACMRSHGITNYPDPTVNSSGVSNTVSSGSGMDLSSPQFQAARQACQSLLPVPGGGSGPAG
jgi:hypothetical protein